MKINSLVTKSINTLKVHSPEIMIVAGITGAVTSTVMACKATLKVNDILEEMKTDREAIAYAEENSTDKYSDKDIVKAKAAMYMQTGVKLVKLYAPSVIVGTLSIATIFASNNILRKRATAALAAYTTIDKGFKEYRGRVVERFGSETDQELLLGIKKEQVEEEIIDENGKKKKVKKTVDVVDGTETSYVRYITKSNPYWNEDGGVEYVLFWLNRQQCYWNDILKTRRSHLVSLNEVYRSLGFDESKAGMVVGWIYDPKDDNSGDNYIEFHTRLVNKLNEYGELEEMIAIDFNVDGCIYDRI